MQGLSAQFTSHRSEGTRSIRGLMDLAPSVEEYAAKFGRNWVIFSLDSMEFPNDPEAEQWATRFSEILSSPDLLAECEDRFLTGEELAEVQKQRERRKKADERRARRAQK